MRFQVLTLAATLVAGCASSPSVSSGNDRVSSSVEGVGTVDYFRDAGMAVNTVDLPVQQAWPRLLTVYTSMGIPVTKLDSTAHIVGAVGAPIPREVGTHKVSYMVNCGSTMTGQVIADTYRMSLTALTQLQPKGAQTDVRTSVSATAIGQSGASSTPVQCSSTGALERDIAAALTRAATP